MARGFGRTGVMLGIAKGIDEGAKGFIQNYYRGQQLKLQKDWVALRQKQRDDQAERDHRRRLADFGKNWSPGSLLPEQGSALPDDPGVNVRQGVTQPSNLFPDYSGALYLDPTLDQTN